MSTPTPTIVLIRPGCTDFDEQHRVQGSLDLPLNNKGRQELRATLEELKAVDLDVLYSGECEPARSFAETLAEKLDLPLHETDLLRNLDQGLWEGQEIDEVRRKFPKVVKQWEESPERVCPPEGEPVADALARMQKALRKPLKKGVSFAVVASEPLASLIRVAITGGKCNCQPLCGSDSDLRIEYLSGGPEPALNPAVDRSAIDTTVEGAD